MGALGCKYCNCDQNNENKYEQINNNPIIITNKSDKNNYENDEININDIICNLNNEEKNKENNNNINTNNNEKNKNKEEEKEKPEDKYKGIFFYASQKNQEMEILNLYIYMTQNFPINGCFLYCTKDLPLEKLQCFLSRFLNCKENILFAMINIDLLNNELRDKFISLLKESSYKYENKLKSCLVMTFNSKDDDLHKIFMRIKTIRPFPDPTLFNHNFNFSDYFIYKDYIVKSTSCGLGKSEFIKNNNSDTNYGTVSYNVVNTLTAYGSVKRGVCLTDGNKLLGLEESKIERENDFVMAYPLSGAPSFKIEDDTKASVNFFVFYPTFFDYLENDFRNFLSESKDLLNDEYMVTEVLRNNMVNNNVTCDIINTNAVWKGITYADDLVEFKKYIAEEIESGIYPVNLYN